MSSNPYRTYDAVLGGAVVYTLLALDREDARRRVEVQLGRRQPELVAQWRAEGRQVRRRG